MPRKRQTKVGRVDPIDVRSKNDIGAFESLLGRGPLTIVLVYADWCGHCQTFKQNMWNEVNSMPNKTLNTASVHYDMVENTSLKNAKIEGYPSLLLVGTNKQPATFKENNSTTNAMPTPQNVSELKSMVNTPIESPVSNANTVVNTVLNNTNTNNVSSLINTTTNNNNVNSINTTMNTTMNTNVNSMNSPMNTNVNSNVNSLKSNNNIYTNMTNNTNKSVNTYVPADANTLEVPDTSLDIPKTTTLLEKTETGVKVGGSRTETAYQQGGDSTLLATLLKITQEAGHVGGLLLAATEYSDLAKRFTRKHKKRAKKTQKRKQRR
jgi:hypothetical protein